MPWANGPHTRQLVFVTQEKQDRNPFCSVPNRKQQLKLRAIQQRKLVNNHKVVCLHSIQTLNTRLEPLECSMTSIHCDAILSMNHLPHTCRMFGRHNREQDAGSFGGCSSSSIQHHGCLPGSRPAFANQGLALLPSSIFCFFLFGFTVSMIGFHGPLQVLADHGLQLLLPACQLMFFFVVIVIGDSFVVAPNLVLILHGDGPVDIIVHLSHHHGQNVFDIVINMCPMKENERKWKKMKEHERTWKKMKENEIKWKKMK